MDSPSDDPAFTRERFDLDALPRVSQPWRRLGLRGPALGWVRLAAGEGATFTHHHERQEEVYVVLEGRGRLAVDGAVLELERGDAVRVAPSARRALAAATDAPLLALVVGAAVDDAWPRDPDARYRIDDGVPHYDDPPPWCADDPAAAARNAELAARMAASAERRAARDGEAR